eukprot:m.103475 g.103475  ORF g.103475 m.103475 type:complete len:573 (+) comp22406_c0_seq1:53-1771(+)
MNFHLQMTSLAVPQDGTRSRSSSCGKDHWDHADDDPSGKAFGAKSITFWGSFCLNLNNCMGPAMVLLPLVNQQAGWLTPTIVIIVIYVFSSLAATMLCEAMQRIPGNGNFDHRYEFATVVRHYYGKRAYIVFQIFYNLSLQASNIAAMIISAQVVDEFITRVAGTSYALDYGHGRFVHSSGLADIPWCDGEIVGGACSGEKLQHVISIGFLVCMAICIPFGYLNLDENMWFQWLSLAGLVLFSIEFYVQFILNFDSTDKICLDEDKYPHEYGNITCDYKPGNPVGNYSDNGFSRTPAFVASTAGQSQVIGIAVFAYAYVVTIPSWVNEKRREVSVNQGVWVAASVGLVMKLLTGLLGAWAYNLLQPDGSQRTDADDILNILVLDNQPKITIYSAYLWDITTLIPGIPVLAIMVRYNLLSGHVCGRYQSFFWGVVSPWLVTAFLYEMGVLMTFCNWVAILVQGYINFVIPALLYRSALLRYPDSSLNLDAVSDTLSTNSNKPKIHIQSRSVDEETPLLDQDPAMMFPVNAVPTSLSLGGMTIPINRIVVADTLIVFFTLLSTASIILNIVDVA